MIEFDDITTNARVEIYESGIDVFLALLREVRELSKKKPDATLSSGKVTLINNVLDDMIIALEGEPQAKYITRIDDEELPQVSDALMMMAQFEAALINFKHRYYQFVSHYKIERRNYWITEEQMASWKKDISESNDDEDEL
jgi:hypothetical protein